MHACTQPPTLPSSRAICLSCTSRDLYTCCPAMAGFCSGCMVLRAHNPVMSTPIGWASRGRASMAATTGGGRPVWRITEACVRVPGGGKRWRECVQVCMRVLRSVGRFQALWELWLSK
eukprot:1158188-Pelagomonas_calceolata.AAC.7